MAATEQLVNFYLEKNGAPNAASPYCLLNTPGFTTICTVPEGPIQTLFTTDTQQFFVAGFSSMNSVPGILPIARGTLSYRMPRSGHDFLERAERRPTLHHLRGCGLPLRPDDAHAHDGHSIRRVNGSLSRRVLSLAECDARVDADFQLMGDGTVWDHTQIVQRSAAPDPWIAMTVINNEIWLMGSQTTEVWFFSRRLPVSPFEPVPGQLIEQGCAAAFSASPGCPPAALESTC